MAYSEEVLVAAHGFASKHRDRLHKSNLIGCFHCCRIVAPFTIDMITKWIDDGRTALCPKCGVDAVIGSQDVTPMSTDFLRNMHDRWFAHQKEVT